MAYTIDAPGLPAATDVRGSIGFAKIMNFRTNVGGFKQV